MLNTGAKLRHQSRWLNAISIECTENELIEISYMPFVKDIQPMNQYHRENIIEQPATKSLNKLNSMGEIDYGLAKEQLEQINVHKAHEAGYFGQGVTVLMLDTGYNLVHPVFDSLNIIAEWDFINNDSTTKNEDGQDVAWQHNHGTSTFSALGGYAPGSLIGPAYKTDFLLAKTEIYDQEIIIEEDYFVLGLEWGEALGADIASSSLGYTDWYVWEDMDGNTAVTTKAIDIATSLGILCVNAVGNENGNQWNHIIAPADADSVISVGAVDSLGTIAGFSSHGPSFDGRIKPEVCARGVATACASGNGTSYTSSNGTSLSTPLVAGAAAVLLSANPTWTPMMVRAALMATADNADTPNNDYGYGVIDVWKAININIDSLMATIVVIPGAFDLYQNYPNPFNSTTTIEYDLKQNTHVELIIYDILGRKIINLADFIESPGKKRITWNGKDDNGNPVSTGVYIYNLILDDSSFTKKMLLLR
ncbi:MAG: S8 family serine peptidase [Candidatus Marinimicrobia bacterium]|nr:S8 family serine peptidase [Candidatus Neomarinimicrobiota bacterium]